MQPRQSITIRRAQAEDISCLIEIERKSPTTSHWTAQQYHYLFAHDSPSTGTIALVAKEKATAAVLGFLVARHVEAEWELENIVVSPEARGQGIGTRLMQELLARAGRARGDALFLEVRESNSAARRLYENLSFEQTGRRKAYYSNPPEDAILYVKRLPAAGISG